MHCCTQAPVVSFFQNNWPNTNARSNFFCNGVGLLDCSVPRQGDGDACLSVVLLQLLHSVSVVSLATFSDLFPAQRQPASQTRARKQQNEIARSWNRVVDRFSARLCCSYWQSIPTRRKADRSNPSTCTAAIMGRSLLSLIPIRFPLLFCACVL